MAERVRLSGLDGVRGLLAVAILIAHTSGLLTPDTASKLHLGLLAQSVIAFFALSGFLIFLPFCRALVNGNDLPDLREYATHRVFRVYPAYLVIFLLANFVLGAVFTQNALVAETVRSDHGTGRLTDASEVLLHLTLAQTWVPGQLQTGLNVAWTLTAEIGFYLLVPLLALGATVVARRVSSSATVLLVPVGAMIVAGVASKLWIHHQMTSTGRDLQEVTFGPHPISVLTESTLTYADVFGFGMAACLVFVLIERGRLSSWTGTRLWATSLPVLGVFTVAALACISRHSVFSSAFLAVAGGICLVLITEPVARGRRSWSGDLLDVAPAKYLGKISLSFYLWHFPVLILVTRWGWYGADSVVGLLGAIALVVGLTFVLGSLTYRIVELPAMEAGRRQTRASREKDRAAGETIA
jgi:peptidoglycan/LPS O-acetylase OafA/YrhL